jgi:ABC-type transporter Mla maintaining outer membrane lipid asymmetry ATPase subunit MlaF
MGSRRGARNLPLGGLSQPRWQDIAELPLDQLNEVRKTLGFLFQHAAPYDSLTVEENVALGAGDGGPRVG